MTMSSTHRRIAGGLIGLAFLGALGGQAIHPAQAADAFHIRGRVGGLEPGVATMLVLRVRNPYRFPIVVRSIRVTVSDAARGCRASNLDVSNFSGHVRIGSRRMVRLRVPIMLLATAPQACFGERFALSYAGKAVRS